MKFLDRAKIYIQSGGGGAGCVSFRREKFIEFGGPNGGDGGRGGHVWAEAVDGLNTLIDFRYQQHYKAKSGRPGEGSNRTGADAGDVVIKVPVGTEIYEEDEETLIADLDELGERVLLANDHDAVLVFARTKAGCAEVADALTSRGHAVDALHGDLSQAARERVVGRLRARRLDVVIATDVAARGLDVDHITHVINLDLPMDTETYVHRIGRTGRGGRDGMAITFATPKEKVRIRAMARELDVDIRQVEIPTDAAIATRRQKRLEAALDNAVEHRPDAAVAWMEAYVAERDLDPMQVAAAAMALFARAEGTRLDEIPDEEPVAWARPPRREQIRNAGPDGRDGPPPSPRADNEVYLFLPVGKRQNVRPGDVVGALANEAGIDGRQIGRVTILDRKTFVGVPKDVATHLFDTMNRVQIRGNDVPLTLARPGSVPDGDRPDRSGRARHGRSRRNDGGDRPPRRFRS